MEGKPVAVPRSWMVEYRKKRKKTQQEMALDVGCSRSAIAQYESGVRFPEPKYMPALCRVYKVKPNKFYEGGTGDVGDAEPSGV